VVPPNPNLQAMRNGADLTDWIITFQGYTGDAPAHSLERWRQTSSEAWLVAALSAAGGTSQSAPALVAAARSLTPASSAYPTGAYHAVRLLVETGQNDTARAMLDDLLPRARKEWPPSALNAVLAERAALARNLAEFASFSLRHPALVALDIDARELPGEVVEVASDKTTRRLPRVQDTAAMLAEDAAEVINRAMSLPLLLDLAESPVYPAGWQETIGQAAWMRAVVLQAPDLATRAARLAAREGATPAAVKLKTLAEAYLAAAADVDRRFAAVFAALRNPGLSPLVRAGLPRRTPMDQIDPYRDNWWCAEPSSSGGDGTMPAAAPAGTFPAQDQRAAAQAEGAKLKAAGPAPNYLARQVLDYARTHPADARVPEALALAVRATRFGCTDKETTKWSKAAFTLLHQKYPTTEWAKGTKYYY
jgi:hypothetical protein